TTDIYAIGVIIYEILVGKKPLGRFKLPTEIDGTINPRFDTIIQKCLAQEAKDRFQSASELKNEILNAIGGNKSAAPTEDLTAQGAESFIGKCRYLDTINETPYGSTVLVENKVNKRLFVIKRHTKGEAGRKEAKLLTTLKHRNIATIIGSGGDNRGTVIISEYASGGALAERMVRKYDWEKAMAIVLQIAAGLDFAHKNNIVHGNLRPSNVFFFEGDIIKVGDFGLPVHYDSTGKKDWYAPPEHKASKQGDIYALGVILHQLITGRTPQYDPMDKLRLDDVKMFVPEPVRMMMAKLLGVRVINRYKSCEELLLDWEAFAREREQRAARPVVNSEPEPVQSSMQKWAWLLIGAGVIIVVVGILLAIGVSK
ncbi:MAG: protein kinase, partial [candidate division Zixibacteria bacterium]|nr:protein kinase [candidate division Zixibacteria bacterium]